MDEVLDFTVEISIKAHDYNSTFWQLWCGVLHFG